MPPFQGYPHYYSPWRYSRAPSRLIWFILGGVAATWYFHAKEGRFIGCGDSSSHRWTGFRTEKEQARKYDQWKQERERLQALGTQAGETVVDMTEASLDSVLSAVAGLKAKLAEQKARRSNVQTPPVIPPESYPS